MTTLIALETFERGLLPTTPAMPEYFGSTGGTVGGTSGSRYLQHDMSGGESRSTLDITAGTTRVILIEFELDATLASIDDWIYRCFDSLGNVGLKIKIDNTTGTPKLYVEWDDLNTPAPHSSPTKITIAKSTRYQVAFKIDSSAIGHKATWGWAPAGSPITTVDTDFTGGNTYAIANYQYLDLGSNAGSSGGETWVWRTYIAAVSGTAADYPIGPVVKDTPRLVDARGTHLLDASPSLFAFENDGSTDTAITSTETTSAGRIDEVPVSTATPDHVKWKTGAGAPTTAPGASVAGTLAARTTAGANAVTMPTHQAGDLLIAVGMIRSTAQTLSTPTGWSAIPGITNPVARSTVARYYFWYKIATSGAEACSSTSSGAVDSYLQVYRVRDVDQTTPFDVNGVTTTGTVDPAVATGITPTTVNTRILAVGWAEDNTSTSVATTDTHADTTYTQDSHTNTTTGADATTFAASASHAAAAATGSLSLDFVGTLGASWGWGIAVLAIRGVASVAQPANTRYLEHTFDNTSKAAAPIAVKISHALRNESGTTTNSITGKVSADAFTNSSDIYAALSIGSASNIHRSLLMTAAPGGAAWTAALVNALVQRWGYTDTASPSPRLENVVVEAIYPAAKAITPATISATSVVSGAVAALRKLVAATVSATATVSGAIGRRRPVTPASVAATSTVTGSIRNPKPITTASVSATSTVGGSVGRLRPISPASISATSTVGGSVVRRRPISPSAVSASSTVGGSVSRLRPIVPASISSTGSVSGTLSKVAAGKNIAPASISATSTVTATVTALRRIAAASIAATSTVAGGAVAQRLVLPAAIAATSTVTGATLRRLRAFAAATVAATSTVTGSVARRRPITPTTVSATATMSGTVNRAGLKAIVPTSISATSTVRGDVDAFTKAGVDWWATFEGVDPTPVLNKRRVVAVNAVTYTAANPWRYSKSLAISTVAGPSYVTWQPRDTATKTPVHQMVFRLDGALDTIKAMIGYIGDAALTNCLQIIVNNTTGTPQLTVAWGQTDGTITAEDTAHVATITKGEWWRIECYIDATATGHKVTWGVAKADDSLLTLKNRNYIGGNTFATTTYPYVRAGTSQGSAGGFAWNFLVARLAGAAHHGYFPISSLTRGEGAWRPISSADPYEQLVTAVEMGTGGIMANDQLNYGNAEQAFVYKIVGACSFDSADDDTSQSLVNGTVMQANTAWIAKSPVDGTTFLHDFYDPGTNPRALAADVGNAGYRARTVSNMNSFITNRKATNGNRPVNVYIDNTLFYATDGGGVPIFENVVPSGYANNAAWRTAMLGWIEYFVAGVLAVHPDTYIVMSISDIADTALGETQGSPNFDYDKGNVWLRAVTQTAALTAKPHAVFREFGIQIASPTPPGGFESRGYFGKYASGSDAFLNRYDEWIGKIDSAQRLGFDVHYMNWLNHYSGGTYPGTNDIHEYVKASQLLFADFTRRRSIHWSGYDDHTADLTHPLRAVTTQDMGEATDTMRTAGLLKYRTFVRGHVIVNSWDSPQTATVLGTSRSLPALGWAYVTTVLSPGAIGATSTVTGSITRKRAVTPTSVSATSAVSGAIGRLRRVLPATNINATSTVGGAIGRRRPVVPTSIAATSTVSGVLSKTTSGTFKPLAAATISATSAVSGAIRVLRRVLPATIAATSSVSGASLLRLRPILPATISATSVVSGIVRRARGVAAASIAAFSSVSGNTVTRRAVLPASVDAVSVVTGSLQRLVAVRPSAISAISTVTGNFGTDPIKVLGAGNIAATSSVTGVVRRARFVPPLGITATSVVQGKIVAARPIVATSVSANSVVSGSLRAARAIRPQNITATSSVDGSVGVRHPLQAGNISAISSVEGIIVRLRPLLSANILALSTVSGVLFVHAPGITLDPTPPGKTDSPVTGYTSPAHAGRIERRKL